MESNVEQEESDSSRASADLRIRKTQVELMLSIRCFKCRQGNGGWLGGSFN